MKDMDKIKSDFVEDTIRRYTEEANRKLEGQFSGTREAMLIISREKVQEFMLRADRGLDKEERELLKLFILSSMMQSFCLGYGLGKIEGQTSQAIYL
ncbi:MAG: hypothetical protein ACOX6S_02550 [Clostridia bacterium]|jgi:hypothetical protein